MKLRSETYGSCGRLTPELQRKALVCSSPMTDHQREVPLARRRRKRCGQGSGQGSPAANRTGIHPWMKKKVLASNDLALK